MRIYTSRYQSGDLIWRSGAVPVRITVGHPRFKLGFELGATVRELAPDRSMFGLSDAEFSLVYAERLESLGVEVIRSLLRQISEALGGRDLVLLCFEDLTKPGEWCHRRTFARWWEERTGERVEELGKDDAVQQLPLAEAQQPQYDGSEWVAVIRNAIQAAKGEVH